VDFLLVIIELLSISVTAEALRANIDCKSPFSKGVGHFAFLAPFGGLGATYGVHLRIIGKLSGLCISDN